MNAPQPSMASDKPDCLACTGGTIGMHPQAYDKILAWHNAGHPTTTTKVTGQLGTDLLKGDGLSRLPHPSDNDSLDSIMAGIYGGDSELEPRLSETEARERLNKYVVAKQIEELEKLHRYDGRDYDNELDEIIDERIAKLKEIGS